MIRQRWVTRLLVLVVLVCALIGMWPERVLAQETVLTHEGWWLPENVSVQGGTVDALFTLIFWVTGIIGLAVFSALIWFLIKYRYREDRKAVYIHGSHRLEMVWTITPAVLLVVMGILSIRAWADVRFDRPDPSREELTEVEVLAQQFQWNIRYPGEDGKFGNDDDIGTFNPDADGPDADKESLISEIVVPVDRKVRIHLMSKDVLHSFFVPNMRQKLDAVPGITGQLWFTPTRVGRYDVMCAELCGPQHYSMQGVLVVLSQEDYAEWLEEKYEEVREILEEYEDEDEEMDEGDKEEDEEDEQGKEEEDVDEDEEEEADEEKEEEETKAEQTTGTLVTADTPADSIVGRVVYGGKPKKGRPMNPGADDFCQKAHAKNPIMDEALIVGTGKALKNVFVQVTQGPALNKKHEAPAEPVVLDQNGCRYVPHVFGIMAGQPFKIRNSDTTNHNVHGLAGKNKEFNFAQSTRGATTTLNNLTKPESFKIKCEVHAWMNTWCHVMEHPFYAVTAKDGTYSIEGLEPGEYEISFWHESLGPQTAKVKLESEKPAEVDTVTLNKRRRR